MGPESPQTNPIVASLSPHLVEKQGPVAAPFSTALVLHLCWACTDEVCRMQRDDGNSINFSDASHLSHSHSFFLLLTSLFLLTCFLCFFLLPSSRSHGSTSPHFPSFLSLDWLPLRPAVYMPFLKLLSLSPPTLVCPSASSSAWVCPFLFPHPQSISPWLPDSGF